MSSSLRERAATGGSVLLLLVVILLISADAETALALGAFCVVGYASYYGYRTSSVMRPIRSQLTPRRKRGVGLLVSLGVVFLVADAADEGLWVAAMIAFGYTGYRSGRVLRGALYGAVVGVVSSAALVVLVGGVLLLASVLDVGGTRRLLFQALLAPQVVGFFTLLWGLFVLVLGGITGLVSGGVGGAIARLRTAG